MSVLSQFKEVVPPLSILCELLIVGGGGSALNISTAGRASGGGGAGQVKYWTNVKVNRGSPITVAIGAADNLSSFGEAIAGAGYQGGGDTSAGQGLAYTERGGGGGGAGHGTTASGYSNKGFGGGVFSYSSGYVEMSLPASGVATVESYGKDGGIGYTSITRAGGGGGGATGNGTDGTSTASGVGGAGLSNSITGSAVVYGTGGSSKRANADANGTNGSANTGDGGGGASRNTAGTSTGGLGGSGVVIIAYVDSYPEAAAITGTYTTPTRSGYRVYRFTGSGSITL